MDVAPPKTMLAVRQGGRTSADIVVGEVPRPVPGADEVLVRVEASSINPFDVGVVLGHPGPTVLEHLPGRDLAGVVEEGPPELVGQSVWATGGEYGTRRHGFQAEYAVVPVDGVRVRPPSLSPAEAGSVGVAFTTAWDALVEIGGLQLGDRVLVTGAAGSVGSAGLQIAASAGAADRYGLVRSEAEEATARAFGATFTAQSADELGDLDEGARPTLCFDTVGGPVFDGVVAAMADSGRIVNISSPGDGMATFDLRAFYRRRLTLHGLGSARFGVVHDAGVLEVLRAGFESGALRPPQIAATFPLARATEAYARVNEHPPGKVVITMTDDP